MSEQKYLPVEWRKGEGLVYFDNGQPKLFQMIPDALGEKQKKKAMDRVEKRFHIITADKRVNRQG